MARLSSRLRSPRTKLPSRAGEGCGSCVIEEALRLFIRFPLAKLARPAGLFIGRKARPRRIVRLGSAGWGLQQ
jgi:hypothetical protein